MAAWFKWINNYDIHRILKGSRVIKFKIVHWLHWSKTKPDLDPVCDRRGRDPATLDTFWQPIFGTFSKIFTKGLVSLNQASNTVLTLRSLLARDWRYWNGKTQHLQHTVTGSESSCTTSSWTRSTTHSGDRQDISQYLAGFFDYMSTMWRSIVLLAAALIFFFIGLYQQHQHHSFSGLCGWSLADCQPLTENATHSPMPHLPQMRIWLSWADWLWEFGSTSWQTEQQGSSPGTPATRWLDAKMWVREGLIVITPPPVWESVGQSDSRSVSRSVSQSVSMSHRAGCPSRGPRTWSCPQMWQSSSVGRCWSVHQSQHSFNQHSHQCVCVCRVSVLEGVPAGSCPGNRAHQTSGRERTGPRSDWTPPPPPDSGHFL